MAKFGRRITRYAEDGLSRCGCMIIAREERLKLSATFSTISDFWEVIEKNKANSKAPPIIYITEATVNKIYSPMPASGSDDMGQKGV